MTAFLNFLFHLAQLYIVPEVLSCVERKAAAWELLGTIGAFTAALFVVQGLQQYIVTNTLFPRVEMLADIVEVVLTMARNGIAYVVLINLVLQGALGVPEFVLYFAAVSTFTAWVMGILREMGTLHKESLDISEVRAFLGYSCAAFGSRRLA